MIFIKIISRLKTLCLVICDVFSLNEDQIIPKLTLCSKLSKLPWQLYCSSSSPRPPLPVRLFAGCPVSRFKDSRVITFLSTVQQRSRVIRYRNKSPIYFAIARERVKFQVSSLKFSGKSIGKTQKQNAKTSFLKIIRSSMPIFRLKYFRITVSDQIYCFT